ncbi:eukaryotic translation initiation factor 2D-like isoform X2 [Photinus pyralis]|uniref:eukaryotic translation initiation factor 2D-like isoform X2 n=1 Tax=Photinus pyralis TaxID=7054 RepID=UPI0012675097|nr:eukaryotic translation initiation factor 2D-like isoform X2 [Photinus pyralis]
MFLKPFKMRSTHQLNKTERRELKKFCIKSFPLISDCNFYEDWITRKDRVTICKLLTYGGEFVNAYLVNQVPLFFEYDEQLFPTVYFLWRHPDALLYFTTHSQVVRKLQNGADLMLPGLCPEIYSSLSIATFERGTKLFVNTSNNKAAVAVGVTADSASVLRSCKVGKCAIIYHSFDDFLCKINNMPTSPIPQLGQSQLPIPSLQMLQPVLEEPNTQSTSNETPTSPNEEANIKAMDDLLLRCLLVAMKFTKDIKIPMLVSTFCNTYIKEACPAADIKKSSYGRITAFLQKCAKDELISLSKKGHIYVITEFNYDHQLVKEFEYNSEQEPKISVPTQEKPKSMTVRDVYFITQPVLPLFQKMGMRPGTAVSVPQIDEAIKDYLKTHNLALQGNQLDAIDITDFIKSLLPKEGIILTYLDLKKRILDRMTKGHTLKIGDVETTKKGELEPIKITTAFRSNKCVTLVNNAEQYTINLLTLAKECQIGKATGAKVNPGVRPSIGNELQLQGNQITFLKNLLTSKYGVPENCIVSSQKKKYYVKFSSDVLHE